MRPARTGSADLVDVGERLGREGDRPFGLATQLGGVGGIAEQVDVVAARAFGRIRDAVPERDGPLELPDASA